MEEEVAAKQQLLQQLQAENAALQSKMRVLETSLNCSTQIHGLMQLIDGVDRLGISSSSPEVSGASGSLSSRSSSEVAAAAAVAGLVAPPAPGLDACLLRSSGSCGSGSSSADAVGGLDATGSSRCLQEPSLQQQQQQRWFQQEHLPAQAWAPQTAEACQPQQQATAAPSGSSSLPAGLLLGSSAASGDASSSLQAVFAGAQQQQQQALQQAVGGFASGAAAVAAAGQAAAAAGSPIVAAAAAVNTGPLSGQVSSPEQGVVLYKEFLGKAQALMVQRSGSDPGEQRALRMCVCCAFYVWPATAHI
jgi:hypothetical protein